MNSAHNFIILYKKLGETPLEAILRYKNKYGEKKVMTYAGRLDPMAEGLLICLIGDDCKNKDYYLNLNKSYVFEILIGFSTDTHDLLGLILDNTNSSGIFEDKQLENILVNFLGKRQQKYPIYSSKTVNGVQLHTLARTGRLNKTYIPSREVEIFDLKMIDSREIDNKELLFNIINKIDLVRGDFRQDLIKNKWNNVLQKEISQKYKIIKLSIDCSSGTYIRALIRDISEMIKIPMCAYSINRTAIGKFSKINTKIID